MEALAQSLAQSRWTSNALRLLFPAPNSNTQHLSHWPIRPLVGLSSENTHPLHPNWPFPLPWAPPAPRPLPSPGCLQSSSRHHFHSVPLTHKWKKWTVSPSCGCLVAQSCPLFVTPWTAAHKASLSITNSQSLLRLMSIESLMPSNHLILCRSLLFLPLIFASIRVFSNESVLHLRWPKLLEL